MHEKARSVDERGLLCLTGNMWQLWLAVCAPVVNLFTFALSFIKYFLMQPTECCQFVQIYRARQAAGLSVLQPIPPFPASPACPAYVQGRNAKTTLLTNASNN